MLVKRTPHSLQQQGQGFHLDAPCQHSPSIALSLTSQSYLRESLGGRNPRSMACQIVKPSSVSSANQQGFLRMPGL